MSRTAALSSLLAAVVAAPASAETYPMVLMQGLDKVTARVITLEVPVDQTVRFGALEIRAAVCEKRPPEETPESAAFLDVVEKRAGQDPVRVFRGWMFASSPGLSPMQHPVYDMWVVDCVSNAPSAESSAPPGGSP